MNPYEITFRALLGTFLKHGICVERVNVGENTIYISLPKIRIFMDKVVSKTLMTKQK